MSVFIFQNLNLVLGWLLEGALDPVRIVTWVLSDVTFLSPVVLGAEGDRRVNFVAVSVVDIPAETIGTVQLEG